MSRVLSCDESCVSVMSYDESCVSVMMSRECDDES